MREQKKRKKRQGLITNEKPIGIEKNGLMKEGIKKKRKKERLIKIV